MTIKELGHHIGPPAEVAEVGDADMREVAKRLGEKKDEQDGANDDTRSN